MNTTTKYYNLLKEQNKKNIMDLLQQRKMMEKKLENEDESNKNNIKNKYNNILIKNGGYLTEKNYNSHSDIKLVNKYIINNHKLKKKRKDIIKVYNQNNKIEKNGFKK